MGLLSSCRVALCIAFLAQPAFSDDGWWDDLYRPDHVSLSKIVETPFAFQDVDVELEVQFRSVGTVGNPYYTPFEVGSHLNFVVWADDAALWKKPAHDASFPFMFISRRHQGCQMLLKARSYDRFRVTGRVSSVFRGRPWIEVRGIEALKEHITEPALIHLVKAFSFKKARRFDAAGAEFLLASSAPLPKVSMVMVLRERGLCLYAAKRFDEALVALDRALELNPDDQDAAGLRRACLRQGAAGKHKVDGGSPTETKPSRSDSDRR